MPTARKDANAGLPARVIACGALEAAYSGGMGKDAHGVPVQSFRKDLIRAGDWYKASTGQRFTLTTDDLDRMVAEFGKMSLAGVNVPLPVGHTNNPEANRGYLRNLWREGGTLYGRLELIGEDAIKLASRVEVSVCVVPEIVAGDGSKFTHAIEHVALVTDPVINGQGKFVPIAASRGAETSQVPVYRLSTTESYSMESLKAIASALGIEPGEMDENALAEAITAAIGAMKTEMEASKGTAKEAEAKIAASKSEVEALKLSRGLPVANVDAMESKAETVGLKLSRLQETGKVGTVARKRIEALVLGSEGNRPALMLSREVSTAAGLARPLADEILDILADNDPVAVGGKTGSQTIALGRNTPGGDDQNSANRIQEIINQQAKLAGVKS